MPKEINQNSPGLDRINSLLGRFGSIAACPIEEVERLGLKVVKRGDSMGLIPVITPEQRNQAKTILETEAGYLFAHIREYLKAVANDTSAVTWHEKEVEIALKRAAALRRENVPPLFQEGMEGNVGEGTDPVSYLWVPVRSFPSIDFVLNEFNPGFHPAHGYGSSNSISSVKSVVHFATYAFRESRLDPTVQKEFAYLFHKKGFKFKSPTAEEFLQQHYAEIFTFLERTLLPLSRERRHERKFEFYDQGKPLEDTLGARFWYVHYTEEDKAKLVDNFGHRVHSHITDGKKFIDYTPKEQELLRKMRFLFTEIDEIACLRYEKMEQETIELRNKQLEEFNDFSARKGKDSMFFSPVALKEMGIQVNPYSLRDLRTKYVTKLDDNGFLSLYRNHPQTLAAIARYNPDTLGQIVQSHFDRHRIPFWKE